MNNPPQFPLDPNWSSKVAGLLWALTYTDPLSGTQYGHLKNASNVVSYTAAVCTGIIGSNQWTVSTTAPSGGVPEVIFTSATATILLNGTRNSDGSITYSGTTYKIALSINGSHYFAVALP